MDKKTVAINDSASEHAETEITEQAKKKSQLPVLKALIPFLLPYKKTVFYFICALLSTSAMTLAVGHGIRLLIDNGFIGNSSEQLNSAILFIFGLSVVMSIGTFARFYLISWLGERVIADIRSAVFHHIIHLHPGYFETQRSGDIMSRLTTDTALLQSIIGSSLSIALRSLISFSGGLIMLSITNAKLTAIIFLGVPLLLIPVLIFGRRVRKLSRKSQDSIADVGSYGAEIIQQIKTVQSFTREAFEKTAFDREVSIAFTIARARIFQRALFMAIVILLVFIALSCMLWVGGTDVLNGAMSGGDLGAFIFYALIVAVGISSLSEVYGELQRAAGATERIIELLNEKPLISDASHAIDAGEFSAELSLNNIQFNYPTAPNKAILQNFTLPIPANKVLALVGPSGAGKTTVFELLQRFYEPQSGSITLGHGATAENIQQLNLATLRQKIAVVSQTPALFSTNVLENIRYGRLDASDDEVISAAKAAHADEFISQLQQGYHSHLGEKGVLLSGGQRQRLAIARAILKDPDILLLDEATSALDASSEAHVQQALNELMQNRTTVIIAHRLATILHADNIAVIEQGQVIAQGSHETLIENCDLYRTLAELQFGSSD